VSFLRSASRSGKERGTGIFDFVSRAVDDDRTRLGKKIYCGRFTRFMGVFVLFAWAMSLQWHCNLYSGIFFLWANCCTEAFSWDFGRFYFIP
jgi:hypothetical protein